MGDHSESLQVDFDPTKTTYEALLQMFWDSHNPLHPNTSRQYMHAVFYHDEDQHKAILETKKRIEEKSSGKEVRTTIRPVGKFFVAERYHQKFELQKNSELMKPFAKLELKEFLDSTAATRLNGYLGGHGTAAQLESDIKELSFSDSQVKALRKIVKKK